MKMSGERARESALRRGLGHWWTVKPYLRAAPPAKPDEILNVSGPSGLSWTMSWRAPTSVGPSRGLVILLHGLGARYDSRYMLEAERIIVARGLTCVRLDTAHDGERRVHGYTALSQDLMALRAYLLGRAAAVSSGARVLWLGFSLGGHALLSAWAERAPARELEEALLTICTPLDLEGCLAHMDSWRASFYRRRLLSLLMQGQPSVKHGHQTLTSWAQAQGAWADTMGRALMLEQLRLPCLMLSTLEDPFVPPECARAHLPAYVEQRWRRGGHLGFPKTVSHPLDEGLDWFDGLSLERRR